MGFEPTPLRTGALSQRLRPLGQTVLLLCPHKRRSGRNRGRGIYIRQQLLQERDRVAPLLIFTGKGVRGMGKGVGIGSNGLGTTSKG